jgi:hypothetical protein
VWGDDLRHVAKDVVNDVSYAGSLMRGEILGLERRRIWRDEDKLEIVMSVVAIDNNPAERALRPNGIGRKNWLFAGADTGAETQRSFRVVEGLRTHVADVARHKLLRYSLGNYASRMAL